MSNRYPNTRMRRMRADNFSRELLREHRVHVSDLIYPVFTILKCLYGMVHKPEIHRIQRLWNCDFEVSEIVVYRLPGCWNLGHQ